LLLGLLEFVPCPPHNGMPPIERHHHELEPANPVVKSPEVGQFVDEQGIALFIREPLPKTCRK
jgi:hypothetical protein